MFKHPGFLIGAVLGLLSAGICILAVDHALSKLPELLRVCLAISVSLFPLYAAVRAYTSLGEITKSTWIRGTVATLLLVIGHGGIIVVAARQADMGPLALLAAIVQ